MTVGGRVRLAVSVQDRFGNAAADGTIVSFAASRGQLAQKLVPTEQGVAVTWLDAPGQPGPIQVTADVALSEIPTAFATVDVVLPPTATPTPTATSTPPVRARVPACDPEGADGRSPTAPPARRRP